MESQDPRGEGFGNYPQDSERWAGLQHMAEVIALTSLLHRAVQDIQHGLPAQWGRSQSTKTIFLFHLRKEEHVICTVSIKWTSLTWKPGHCQVMLEVKVNLMLDDGHEKKTKQKQKPTWNQRSGIVEFLCPGKKQFLAGRSFSNVLACELTPPSGNHFVL